jgi:hypothetical protein
MEWLNKVPDEWSFKRRRPKDDLTAGSHTVYFASACGTGTVDLDAWQSRTPTRKGAYKTAKNLDAIEGLSSEEQFNRNGGIENSWRRFLKS